MEPQGGLSKATHSKNGKRTVLYCGFVAIVRFFHPFCLMTVDLFSYSQLEPAKAFFGMLTFVNSYFFEKFTSLVSSAIIEGVKKMGEGSALLAYHYFDFKDTSKSHVRGLLASLIFQLGSNSDRCWNVLHELYDDNFYRRFEALSYADLSKCLKSMVELPGQISVFIIMDALDECPSTTGTPSAREEVLNFVEDLVGSSHSNLFLCITSRPEQDIQTVLNPLTSASYRVALHEESGQREDINNYIRHFVHTDRVMRRWREEDKALVINTLSERAGGM